jgi:hypothetical protein
LKWNLHWSARQESHDDGPYEPAMLIDPAVARDLRLGGGANGEAGQCQTKIAIRVIIYSLEQNAGFSVTSRPAFPRARD